MSFQASKQVKPGNNISSTVKIIKCFLGGLGKNYTLQRKSNTPSHIPKEKVTVNEVMETHDMWCYGDFNTWQSNRQSRAITWDRQWRGIVKPFQPVFQSNITQLSFQLGKKYFTEKVIVLWDLQRDLILGIHWQFNYKISCNWNMNGHHYITQNNTYICTSIPLSIAKPIVHNAGAFIYNPDAYG